MRPHPESRVTGIFQISAEKGGLPQPDANRLRGLRGDIPQQFHLGRIRGIVPELHVHRVGKGGIERKGSGRIRRRFQIGGKPGAGRHLANPDAARGGAVRQEDGSRNRIFRIGRRSGHLRVFRTRNHPKGKKNRGEVSKLHRFLLPRWDGRLRKNRRTGFFRVPSTRGRTGCSVRKSSSPVRPSGRCRRFPF